MTPARQSDPVTSHRAAHQAGAFAGTHRTRIRGALQQGPATAYEIGLRCGLTVVQVDRRLIEMARAGHAEVVQLNGLTVVRDHFRVWCLP